MVVEFTRFFFFFAFAATSCSSLFSIVYHILHMMVVEFTWEKNVSSHSLQLRVHLNGLPRKKRVFSYALQFHVSAFFSIVFTVLTTTSSFICFITFFLWHSPQPHDYIRSDYKLAKNVRNVFWQLGNSSDIMFPTIQLKFKILNAVNARNVFWREKWWNILC